VTGFGDLATKLNDVKESWQILGQKF
jgi:hypothetical protein